jgi:peptide deformylase
VTLLPILTADQAPRQAAEPARKAEGSPVPLRPDRNGVLRQRAKKVGKVDRSVQRLLDDMLETMRQAPGIGLAANQVGQLVRVIVVELEDTTLQLVNPEIIHRDGEVVMTEGCLSMPGFEGDVRRPEKVTVRALDRQGKAIKIQADEMLARVLQHEIDHLDGILFVDRLDNLSDLRIVNPAEEPDEIKV